jgi:hypothetical protein
MVAMSTTHRLVTALLSAAIAAPAAALDVTFVVNDAFVKDRMLAGVTIRIAERPGGEPVVVGTSDDQGRFSTRLEAGTFSVSYELEGFVPVRESSTAVHSTGQVITTALSRRLEAEEGAPQRRVRLILNWGSDRSQVRDADAHLACPCTDPVAHVYFGEREHAGDGHRAELDVDDIDWGGPETITLADPAPGTYVYWVHDYSGPPARLAASDVVVRVLFDNRVAGEFRPPPDLEGRAWRPFEAVVIGEDLVPVLETFTPYQLAEGAHLVVPPGCEIAGEQPWSLAWIVTGVVTVGLPIALALVVVSILRRRSQPR